MCAADSRSAPPHNTSAPSVTSVAVSSVHEITSGAPTDEAALSATRVCVTRSNEWFDIAVSADRSSDSEATLQWYSVHSDSCARIHMPLYCASSFLVSNGVSLWVVATLLGHSDPKVTTRYAHLTTKALVGRFDGQGREGIAPRRARRSWWATSVLFAWIQEQKAKTPRDGFHNSTLPTDRFDGRLTESCAEKIGIGYWAAAGFAGAA